MDIADTTFPLSFPEPHTPSVSKPSNRCQKPKSEATTGPSTGIMQAPGQQGQGQGPQGQGQPPPQRQQQQIIPPQQQNQPDQPMTPQLMHNQDTLVMMMRQMGINGQLGLPPSLTSRQPPPGGGMGPGGVVSESNINAEIMRIPLNVILQLKQENGLGDKDLASLTMLEKVRFLFRFFVLSSLYRC